jgi:serine/threonine-protein kinase ATR
LPPSSSITEFWPESQRLVALPQGCQRIITSRSRAALVGFLILQSILSHINQDERSGPSSPLPSTDRGLLPWALDSSTALWRNVRTWGNTTSKVNVHGEIVAAFMQFLDLACLPHIISQRSLQWSTRAAFTLSNGLSDLISTCAHVPFSEPNQVYLASILTRLRASLEELHVHGPPPLRRRDLKSIITDNMALSITNVCQNVAEFKTMHKDLQVRRFSASIRMAC